MLQSANGNVQGINQFILLADASEKVPDLVKDRAYADFQLSKRDWDKLEVIHEVLRVCIMLLRGFDFIF